MHHDDAIIYLGDAAKSLSPGKVGGYLVRFGSGPEDADVQGEWFHRATDFGRAVKAGADVLYHHGLPLRGDALGARLGNRSIGEATLSVRPDGLWAEAQLDTSDPDVKALADRIEGGEFFGWSSGSTERMVRRERVAGKARIDRWPIVEATLSPRPVDRRNRAVPIKSLIDDAAPASLVESAETLVAEVEAIVGAFKAHAAHRRAEGRDFSATKREAVKALGDALAALHDATAPRPDPETLARVRRLLIAGRI